MLWFLTLPVIFACCHGFDLEGLWGKSEETCGETNRVQYSNTDDQKGYIVGGRDAFQGEFPWQISLQRHFERDNGIYHICGGTIITKDWVVTAAHCINLAKLGNYRVVAGISDLREENKIRTGVVRSYSEHKVDDAYIHEDFSRLTLQNDIAVLKVDPPFDFEHSDGMIKPICLPSFGHEPRGYATVSGWGTLKEGSRVIPTRLQAVSVPIISDEACRKAYGEAIVETMVCAGYEEGMRDSCQGDSGGPLIQKSGSGNAVLVGVVSWGMGCARPKYPGVYTQVSYYVDWINGIIKSQG
ncbi:Trypsin-1, partial [Stegodyphus mimosarum]